MTDEVRLIDSIAERDLDIAILSALHCSDAFRRFFVESVVGYKGNHSLFSARVSEWEAGRETDVLLVVDLDDGQRLAVMIEDKISADFQPAQANGYRERGLQGVLAERWTKFATCLCAPLSYIDSARAANEWDAYMSLESIIELSRKSGDRNIEFVANFCKQAITKRADGRLPISLDRTLFWRQYRRLATELLPGVSITRLPHEVSKAKQWPRFGANFFPSHIFLEHKSDEGHVDLTFDKFKPDKLKSRISITLPDDVSLEPTCASSALRIKVSKIDRLKTFDDQKDEMIIALAAVERLLQIGKILSLTISKSGEQSMPTTLT